jgi:membrane protein
LLLAARYLFALARDLATGELTLRAMSLVYTTMLAIVPLLGFGFALAKVLGFHTQLEPLLLRVLEPIGPRAADITRNITDFADNINGGVLGILSFGVLLLTVISMAQKVESSFNFVWRVDRPRSFARRFSEYMSVIMVGPLVMVVATTLIASLSSVTLVERLRAIEPICSWIAQIGELLPYLIIAAAFAFLNAFIPNTRVRLKPALLGGFASGIAWAASGYLFTSLVVSSARLQSIYSGFAIVLILMFWLYLSWLILLLGSQLAYYVQNPFNLRFGQRTDPSDNDARERLSLGIMYLIASDYAQPSHGWTNESLAAALRVPRDVLEPVMAALSDDGLVVMASEHRLVPGRDPHRIALTDILAAVRGRRGNRIELHEPWNASVEKIIDRINDSIAAELGNRTLGALVDENLADNLAAIP